MWVVHVTHRPTQKLKKLKKLKKALKKGIGLGIHSFAPQAFSRPGRLRLSRKPKHSRRARCRAFRRFLLRLGTIGSWGNIPIGLNRLRKNISTFCYIRVSKNKST